MTLEQYMTLNRLSLSKMAEEIGVSQSALTLYVQGKRMPRPWVMRNIYRATQGQVTPNDFFDFRISTKTDRSKQRWAAA